jgi:CheY-like chemotaxis protein
MSNERECILIVDDTVENIDVLYNLLKDSYDIKVATDGKKALEIVEISDPPDLILLDIIMPEMDGYDTIKQLKKNPKTKDIPVIFLTSKTDVDDIVKGFDYGAVDYVGKPFNAPELKTRIHTQITLNKQKDLIRKRSNELKELLQIICHDLANNLSTIKSSIWLAENKAGATLDSYKDKIKMATVNAIDIIDLVREMRSVEDKKLPLQKVNLLVSVSDSLKLFSDTMSQKKIKTEIDIAKDLDVMVEPRSFVNSVINNIMSNAIKFSFPNSTIRIGALDNGGSIHLMFKDTGMGIPANMLDQIFDLSKRTNRLGTQGEHGTGFGMPLIKRFVTLYGGEIQVSSEDIKKTPRKHGTEIRLILNKA